MTVAGRLQRGASRVLRLLTRPRWIVTRLTRLHAAVLRSSRGRIRRSRILAGGQPVLSLTTTGRRSGQQRSTIVAYLRDHESFVVYASNLGSERDPSWCLNLDADPQALVVVDGQQIRVTAQRARDEHADRLWDAYAARLPAVEHFRAIAGREIPIFVLTPSAG